MRKSIDKIDTLLKDFQQEIHKQKSVLRTVDLEDNLKDIGLLDYSVTPLWWEGTTGGDQLVWDNLATFLPTPEEFRLSIPSKITPQPRENLWGNLSLFPVAGLNSSAGPLNEVTIPGGYYTFPTPPTPTKTRPPLDQYFKTYSPTKTNASFTRPAYPFSVPPYTPSGPSPIAVPYRQGLDNNYLPSSPSTWVHPLRPIPAPNNTDVLAKMMAETRPSDPSETTARVSTVSPSRQVTYPGVTGNLTSSIIFNLIIIYKAWNTGVE